MGGGGGCACTPGSLAAPTQTWHSQTQCPFLVPQLTLQLILPTGPREGAREQAAWRLRPEGVGLQGSQEQCLSRVATQNVLQPPPPKPQGSPTWACEEGIHCPFQAGLRWGLTQEKEAIGPWGRQALSRAHRLGQPLPSVNATLWQQATSFTSLLAPRPSSPRPSPQGSSKHLWEQMTPSRAAEHILQPVRLSLAGLLCPPRV